MLKFRRFRKFLFSFHLNFYEMRTGGVEVDSVERVGISQTRTVARSFVRLLFNDRVE